MDNIKKILCISNHSFMLGGGEKSFLELISHLPEPWDVLAVTPGEGELTHLIQQKGIKTKCLDLPSMKPFNIHNVTAGLVNYRNLIQDYKPSLIYANGPRAVFYGGIVGRILKIPVIWHCRIADRDKYLDPLLCRLSNKIVANSSATAKRFKPVFQHKVATVHNGIDIKWMQENNAERPLPIQADWKVILVVARLSKWKRHDVALDAFEKIASQHEKLHFVCVGAKDQLELGWYDYLIQKTRQSKFSNRIYWIGQVADVRPWYQSADILLLPSENEPFGRVLVEAMACGVPVIATRSGGVPEIVRDGIDGILVSPGNVDELFVAALRILENESFRIQLSEAAKKRAESFSLKLHIENMVEIFENTAKSFKI